MKAFIPAEPFLSPQSNNLFSSVLLRSTVHFPQSCLNWGFFLIKCAGQHNALKQTCSRWWLEMQNREAAVSECWALGGGGRVPREGNYAVPRCN